MNYLVGGDIPEPLGTAHPNTVPYQAFETGDGHIIIAANNDDQFRRFAILAGRAELLDDARFATNQERVRNRDLVVAEVRRILHQRSSADWIAALTASNVPVCPINRLDQVFADPQILARGMKISMPHPAAGGAPVDMIGNPIKLSETPVTYRRPPPALGEHTQEVLQEVFALADGDIADLRAGGVI